MFEASSDVFAVQCQSVDSPYVTARYLLHICHAHIYVDADMRICRGPRDGPVDDPRPLYFEPLAGASPLDARWDPLLSRFSREQRSQGRIWVSQVD